MTTFDLVTLSSPQAGAVPSGAVGLLALGAVEQHGPHLPVGTDMLIARALAERVAEAVSLPVVLLPAPVGGLSDHHLAFPGTFSLQADTLEALLDAVLAGAKRMGVTRFALFSAHGGNFTFIDDYAARRPVVAFADLARWFEVCAEAARSAGLAVAATDQHAGIIETSQALDLFPLLVRDAAGVEGFTDASPGWEERLWEEGVEALSPVGVLGDPRGATAAAGVAINAALTRMLAAWLTDCFGPDGDRPAAPRSPGP